MWHGGEVIGVRWSKKELLSIHEAAARKPLLLLGGKKGDIVTKKNNNNKGKPSCLFNHLIHFSKERQNKIMEAARWPVRADLHVRKLFFKSYSNWKA